MIRNLVRYYRPVTSGIVRFSLSRAVTTSRVIPAYITQHRTVYKHNFHTSARNLQENKNNVDNKGTHIGTIKVDKPQYMLAFTCKKCNNRSSHTISKQAYQHGSVMVTCPHCKNRHLIADHLKIFNDDNINIEDIMKANGETVSQSTDDLVFDEIPDSIKNLIGHYAKDAPKNVKQKLDNETVHGLPPISEDK